MRGRVEICGINTAKLPVLRHEENMALLRRVKQGDEQARQELICGNLRLVLAAVKRFAGRSENVDDLFQVGCIGLMKSIDAFDLSYDVRLSSYSLPMIIGEIRRYLRDNSPIRVSRSVRDTAYRVLQARERLLVQQQPQAQVFNVPLLPVDVPIQRRHLLRQRLVPRGQRPGGQRDYPLTQRAHLDELPVQLGQLLVKTAPHYPNLPVM